MSEEVAKRICEQMTYDIEDLCDCCRKNEKDRTCIGCKELAIETILKENQKLKQRIAKVIEFLKENCFGISYMEISYLLEILKGDSNE